MRGRRGAYFVVKELELGGQAPGEISWKTIADVNHDHADVIELHHRVLDAGVQDLVNEDVQQNQERLLAISKRRNN